VRILLHVFGIYNTFYSYDIRMGACTQDRVGFPVTHALFSNDRNCVLASSLDNTVRLFDVENGEMLAQYTGHKNSEYKVTATLSSDDAHVICGSEDGRVCFWDLVEVKLVWFSSLQNVSLSVTRINVAGHVGTNYPATYKASDMRCIPSERRYNGDNFNRWIDQSVWFINLYVYRVLVNLPRGSTDSLR
jgi:WD40 repeat protein